MKATIKIWNPTTGTSVVTLKVLKTMINDRRKEALSRISNDKTTVFSMDKSNQQVACHYTSFNISQFTLEKALTVYNQGGCQKAILS